MSTKKRLERLELREALLSGGRDGSELERARRSLYEAYSELGLLEFLKQPTDEARKRLAELQALCARLSAGR